MWFRILNALDLDERKMPRDVATRWNSTYDMLEFTVKYRSAIDDITGDKSTNLRKYEMDEEEWRIAVQLQNTLKVRALRSIFGNQFTCPLAGTRYSRMPHSFSLVQPLVSRPSSLLWTILTKPSPTTLLIPILNHQSTLLLESPRKHSISTIMQQINRKYIALRW